MRNFQTLDYDDVDVPAGVILFDGEGENARLSLRREGDYIVISASHGPIEIALRPRFLELSRAFRTLQPIEGLQTTRQIGTAQSYLAVGLRADGGLILRPTLVADAFGHLCLNLALTSDARQKLFAWLEIA